MKKSLSVIMAVVLLIIISACSGSNDNSSKDAKETSANTNFPDEPITMLVPFAPGSVNDNNVRLLSQKAEEFLPNDQPINIENVEGGGGILAFTQLMNADPDGYKLAYGTVSHVSVLPHLGEATFTHDSFQPVMKDTAAIPLLMVPTDAPYDNFDEWLEHVEKNPGEFSYGTTGPGSISNLSMVSAANALDVDLKNVTYEGGSQSITALLGGNVDGAVVMPANAYEHIEAGTLKPIFEFRDTTEYDDAKALNDIGLEEDDVVQAFAMLFANKDIPEAELEILHDAFKKAQETDEYVDNIANIGSEFFYLNPQDSQENATNTYKVAGELLKELGLID